MTQKKGMLICLEGGEACGKTTVMKDIITHLESNNINFENFREPGGLPVSEDIRSLIFKHELNPESEAMLFAAARSELMKNKIIPLLESGTHIILDRFLMSSLCYQGYCRNVGIEKVFELNKLAIGDYLPNLNILLDIPPQKALARLEGADREINRFDKKGLDFHEKVREGYLKLSEMFSDSFAVINADQNSANVSKDVLNAINEVLEI